MQLEEAKVGQRVRLLNDEKQICREGSILRVEPSPYSQKCYWGAMVKFDDSERPTWHLLEKLQKTQ